MKQKLTKKLRDAGFYTFTLPTLSELIDACGEDFMLTNECGRWEAWKESNNSTIRMGECGAKYECSGATPEEAVANLWLAINKK